MGRGADKEVAAEPQKNSKEDELSAKDKEMIECFALDQLVEDAQVRTPEEDMFAGHNPQKKTRRCRAAASREIEEAHRLAREERRKKFDAQADRTNIVPLGLSHNLNKVELGSAGVFQPVPSKRVPIPEKKSSASFPGHMFGAPAKASRLQNVKSNATLPHPRPCKSDEHGFKRQRTSPPRIAPPRFWCPSFRGQGALTGIPLDANSGVKPMFPSQPPAQFVQPSWPDPAMLRKLAKGSAADLLKATQADSQSPLSPGSKGPTDNPVELLGTLQKTITKMGNMMEALNAKVAMMEDRLAEVEDS